MKTISSLGVRSPCSYWRIILAKGKLATIHYDSAPRPQRSCFAHPIIHSYIFAICIFEQIASEKLNKENVARTMRSYTLSHVKFENIYTFTLILSSNDG